MKTLETMLTDLYAQHGEGEVFVTDKVSYVMSNVTKRARKNYLGVFDEPYDSVTGDEKFFPPLTEAFTDGVIKSIDFDTKDVSLFTNSKANPRAVRVAKALLKKELDKAEFAKVVNKLTSHLAIDGHGILKFVEDRENGKKVMRVYVVDIMNIVVDQSAESLHDATGFMERSLMNYDEVNRKRSVWQNVDEVLKNSGSTDFSRYPKGVLGQLTKGTAPLYPIYEYWGQVDKSWITGNPADAGKWSEGNIVAANVQDAGKLVILYKAFNKKGLRPYEDVPLKKVIGRLQGRGVPEQLFGTQKYLNMIVNIRKKNAQILQNGLFKAKRGLGLTADSIISKISAGGIVQVDEMDDFQQMPIDDTRQASYADEDRLVQWGERNTGAYDVRRGEMQAASSPATNTLIQDRNSRDLFQLIQENIGAMLEAFIQKHVLPWVIENATDGDIVNYTGDIKELESIDDAEVEREANTALVTYVEKYKRYPDPNQVMAAMEKAKKKLSSMGTTRRLEVRKKMLTSTDFGVKVQLTSEAIDRNTMLARLQEMLAISLQSPGALDVDPQGIMDEMFDLLDIDLGRVYNSRRKYQTPLMKEVAGAATQAANAVNGRVAPQQNASAMTPLQRGARRPQEVTQDAANQTQLQI